MIKIKNVTIKNFLSIGNVTQAMKLDDSGLTLILGETTDAHGGITRNGSGKTTLLQAISYGLYGKPITKIKIPNLVNNINGKGMVVSIDFEKDGVSYRVVRGKKPDIMEFYINDQKQKLVDESDDALGENKHTQAEITRLMGMSYTMFKHIVALNTFSDPFLKLGTNDQKNIIEELLGITQISQRAETLKKLIGETKDSVKSHDANIKAITDANSRIRSAMASAQDKANKWKVSQEQKIKELHEDVEHLSAIDFDKEISKFDDLDSYVSKEKELKNALDIAKKEMSLLDRECKNLEAESSRLREEANRGVDDQIRRLEEDKNRKNSYIKRHVGQIEVYKKEIIKIEDDLLNSNGSICVCCGQKLDGTEHLKEVILKLEVSKRDVEEKIVSEEKEIASLKEGCNKMDEMISELRLDNDTKVELLRKQADEVDKKSVTMQDAIISIADDVDRFDKELRALGEKPETAFSSRDEAYRVRQSRDNLLQEIAIEQTKANPFDTEVSGLKSAIQEIDYTPLNDAVELLKHQEFLYKLLSNKDSFIRKKIIDQNLSYLNSRLSYYLDKLGLPHEVIFQSDLTVEITKLGRDYDFEQLSRGEMNRVIMATSWSFRDIWESTNSGCNLLWVDELLDVGLDTQGVESALGILKSLARDRGKNVFLISHRDELQARIDRTLLVKKENDFTQLSFDGL